MSNPSILESLKIGRTSRDPETRAKELSGTSVPTPYRVEYSRKFKDAVRTEKTVHETLQEYRVSSDREFFAVPLYRAIKVIDDLSIQELEQEKSELQQTHQKSIQELNDCYKYQQDTENYVEYLESANKTYISNYWRMLSDEWKNFFDLYYNTESILLVESFEQWEQEFKVCALLEMKDMISILLRLSGKELFDDNIIQDTLFFIDKGKHLKDCPKNILKLHHLEIVYCLNDVLEDFKGEMFVKKSELESFKIFVNICLTQSFDLDIPKDLTPLSIFLSLSSLTIPRSAINLHTLLGLPNLRNLKIFEIDKESLQVLKSLQYLEEVELYIKYSEEYKEDILEILNFFELELEYCKISLCQIAQVDRAFCFLISDWEIALQQGGNESMR